MPKAHPQGIFRICWEELYGIDVSPSTISKITDKVWELVEAWQNRPLAPIYAIVYLDAIHIKLKRDGKIENVAVYNVLGIDLEGHKEVFGHWDRGWWGGS